MNKWINYNKYRAEKKTIDPVRCVKCWFHIAQSVALECDSPLRPWHRGCRKSKHVREACGNYINDWLRDAQSVALKCEPPVSFPQERDPPMAFPRERAPPVAFPQEQDPPVAFPRERDPPVANPLVFVVKWHLFLILCNWTHLESPTKSLKRRKCHHGEIIQCCCSRCHGRGRRGNAEDAREAQFPC